MAISVVSGGKDFLCAGHVARLQGGADLSEETPGIDIATRRDLSLDLGESIIGARQVTTRDRLGEGVKVLAALLPLGVLGAGGLATASAVYSHSHARLR